MCRPHTGARGYTVRCGLNWDLAARWGFTGRGTAQSGAERVNKTNQIFFSSSSLRSRVTKSFPLWHDYICHISRKSAFQSHCHLLCCDHIFFPCLITSAFSLSLIFCLPISVASYYSIRLHRDSHQRFCFCNVQPIKLNYLSTQAAAHGSRAVSIGFVESD